MLVSYFSKIPKSLSFVVVLFAGLQLASASTTLPSSGSILLDLTSYTASYNFTLSASSPPVWGYYNTDGYVEYTVNSATGGSYAIEISYTTPNASAGMNFFVNGTYMSSTPLPSTGSWGSFTASAQKTFSLGAGDNRIRISGWTRT